MFNQMKRKMFFRLTVVLVAAVSVLIACTQDYSTDIKSLQDKYDALEQQFNDLQGAIDNGSVISKVEQTANGIKVTAKDGKTYEVTNGEKGEPGDSWEIGANGNWFKNGVDSGKPARGEQGVQGLEGEPGVDGDFYKPCTDKESEGYGHWILVNGETGAEQVLEEMWLPVGTITAVWDEDAQTISFHNVEGVDGGVITIINPKVDLKSIAVIPEMWDATLGMPGVTVYSIYPTTKEFERILLSNGQKGYWGMWNGIDGWGGYFSDIFQMGGYPGFAQILFSTYCGKTGQRNLHGYVASFDLTSGSFANNSQAIFENAEEWFGPRWEMTYEYVLSMVDVMIEKIGKQLGSMASLDETYTRQFPVSDLNLKYRVNPAGADMSAYDFTMIDRVMEVSTKAEGDKVSSAVPALTVKQNGPDQLDVTGYINYFKYWENMPFEWLMKMFSAKIMHSWNLWSWRNDDMTGSMPNLADVNASKFETLTNPNGSDNYMGADIKSLGYWMDAAGVSWQTVVALQATNKEGTPMPIVSDYASIKMDFVCPIWTAYNYHAATLPVEKWQIPHNIYNWWKGMENYMGTGVPYENDTIKVGETYDVKAHMRFADPYLGTLENLGFQVKYFFHVFCSANNMTPRPVQDANGNYSPGSGQDNQYGGTEMNWGIWDKVECTDDGKVKVKDGVALTEVLDKFFMITADAAIWNEATQTWYNSGCTGLHWGNSFLPNGVEWSGTPGLNFDEFQAQYMLKVVSNPAETTTIEFDLGTVDYFALPAANALKAPKDILLEAAAAANKAEFDTRYAAPTTNFPTGYAGAFALADANDNCISVTLSSATTLGEHAATYTFAPKVTGANTIVYKVKYTVEANVPATLIPTLNPDYLVPEVESTVIVKGKAVENTWRPQSSIREHFKNYDEFDDDLEENVLVDFMFVKLKEGQTGAVVFPASATYTSQEIELDGKYAIDETQREVVVEAYLRLASGSNVKVKEYTVRFINPFEISAVENITLETHTIDWCRALAAYTIKEVGTGETLVTWNGAPVLSTYAQNIYLGVFTDMTSTWSSGATNDSSFGDNLWYVKTTGWFYWNNNGTLLQQEKNTTFSVEVVNQVAKLKAAGTITIKKSADSAAEHPGDAVSLPQEAVNAHEN